MAKRQYGPLVTEEQKAHQKKVDTQIKKVKEQTTTVKRDLATLKGRMNKLNALFKADDYIRIWANEKWQHHYVDIKKYVDDFHKDYLGFAPPKKEPKKEPKKTLGFFDKK